MTRKRVPLGNFVTEYSARNKNDEDIPVYSVTNSQGFCREYFGKEVASKDKTTYKIVPYGYFAYNPSRINVGSVDWQRCETQVIVSPLYNVFSVSDELDRQFLYYFLKSNIGRQMIRAKAAGSVRDNLKLDMLKEITIPESSLDDQRHCTATLDNLQYLIELRKKQLNKLDNLVKARFVEMFGDYLKDDRRPLSEVAIITGGLTKNSNRNTFKTKMPYLRVANVFYNRLDLREILEIGVKEEEIEKTLLQAGDLLFVEGNGSIEQIGRVAIWDGSIDPILHQNHLIKARFNNEIIAPEYALFYFMLQDGRQQIISKSVSTSGLNTLSVNKVSSLLLPIPPIALQKQFGEFIKQTDKSKVVVQKALDEAQTLFDSLMQEYFG